MELISKLGIDWKLLIAQIVNFFILLFVLHKFVYKPVLEMLEKRSKTIEKGMRDAKESTLKLEQIEKLSAQRKSETEKEIGKLFDEARAQAETMKKEMMAAAASQADDLLRRTKLQITEEKEKMIQEVKREISSFILQTTQKVLQREFSEGDQKRLLEAITEEMKS